MTDSQRVPGYPLRYIAAKKLDDDRLENAHQLDVQGNHDTTIEPRVATSEDAKRIGRRKPSSLQ